MKGKDDHSNSSDNSRDNFTLDKPVTRQIIAVETKLSYSTVCRRLKELDYVHKGNCIAPKTYERILIEWGFLEKPPKK